MKNLTDYKKFLLEKKSSLKMANTKGEGENELSKQADDVGDNTLKMISKQLKDYIQPDNKKDGFNAKISKSKKSIKITSKDKPGVSITISGNGKPNNFYNVVVKNAKGEIKEGDTNTSENILAFVANEFDHSSGIDAENKTTKNGNINNKIKTD